MEFKHSFEGAPSPNDKAAARNRRAMEKSAEIMLANFAQGGIEAHIFAADAVPPSILTRARTIAFIPLTCHDAEVSQVKQCTMVLMQRKVDAST